MEISNIGEVQVTASKKHAVATTLAKKSCATAKAHITTLNSRTDPLHIHNDAIYQAASVR